MDGDSAPDGARPVVDELNGSDMQESPTGV